MDLSCALPSSFLSQWQGIVELAATLTQAPAALITHVVDGERLQVISANEAHGNPYATGDIAAYANHYCEAVIRRNEKLRVDNAPADVAWRAAPEIEHGLIAYLGFPLRWPDGTVFGTICLLEQEPNRFAETHEALMERLRDLVEAHLALAAKNIELANQTAALDRRLEEIESLRRLIPICAGCKKVRKDDGFWQSVEAYLHEQRLADFSHGICPDCMVTLYGTDPHVK